MSFQAKIKLGALKSAPLTHTGFKGRAIKKGESFTTTNPEEALYYRAQPGYSVTVLKGKLPVSSAPEAEPDDVEEESSDEGDDKKRDDEVKGTYERADLKKMSREDLIALVKTDDDLPLTLRDVPKKASKREIIDLILGAQTGDEDDEEDD
jgi:hypothetical protein